MILRIPKYQSNGIKIYCSILLFLCFAIAPASLASQDLAFPTATGAGAYATGGRGKPVYKVTNLNNSGIGSFRQCLEDTKLTDGGIITFMVSGTINLTSEIYFYNQNNITIAGQTAPEGGIAISNYKLRFQNVNNLIMRYIRIRPNYPVFPASEIDSFEIFQSSNYIIDHCSFSWGTDESVGSGIGNNYTWQRNIFAESKTGMIMGGEASDSYDLSFNNNLFYHCSHRFPNWNSNGRVDVINNVIWNWRSRMSVPAGGFEVNHINNYYVHYTSSPVPDTDIRGMLWYPNTINFPTIYTNGNYITDVLTDPDADNWAIWRFRFNPSGTIYSGVGNESPLTTDFRTLLPFPQLGRSLNIKSAVETLEDITLNVGSNARLDELGFKWEEIDIVDDVYLTNVQNGIIIPYTQDNVLETQHHDDYIESISSTPINNYPIGYDTDIDGMPDAWEANRFGNLNNNGQIDTNDSGYTDIEDYLNRIDFNTEDTVIINATNNTICQGQTTTLTASGANSYLWESGETDPTVEISPDTTTTYKVTGTHSDGTTTNAEIIITVNETPIAVAGEDIETCLGTPVTLTATGGSTSATYQWSNTETTASIQVNPNITTTYTVEVFEDNCSSTDEVIVTVNETPNVNAGEDQTIFDGETATLTATGADSYEWSTGEITQTISVNPLLDTSYSVTGIINSCQNIDTVTVFLLDDSVNANAGDDTVVCLGQTIILTAIGGTTYLWNTGETSASINVAPTETTTYTVTAFSLSGNNFEDDSVIVTVNEIPVANAGEDTSICFGNVTTLTASGGVTYLWSNGQTTQSISVNPTETTTYTVEVFENNCSSIDQAQVTVNALPETNAGNDISITEGAAIILTASGADSYAWNTGETTSSITVSPNTITTYTVTGANSNGCELMDEVIVTIILDDITANAGVDIAICNGESTTLTASGGASYLWNTGESTAAIEVSPLGTTIYTVTAYSISGNNTDEDSVEVTVNEIPAANAGDDISICFGNGTTLTASGGTTYLWSTGQTTETIAVNPNNTTIYTVEVFENNCSSVDQIQVTVNELPQTNAGNNVSIFEGDFITLTASGAGFYVWSTGETTSSITVIPDTTTTYTVMGTNSNGCELNDSVTVSVEIENINANAGANVSICNGESTTLDASGGASYVWSTGETTAIIDVSPEVTTTYIVTVFSSNGTESDDDSVTVTVNEIPVADAGNDVTICLGNTTTLTASGGTTYLWSTGETTQNITVSPNNTVAYVVEVFTNNCSSEDDIVITVNDLPDTNAGNDVTITEGDSTTLIGTGAASYIWSTGETTSSISVNPMTTTTYTLTGVSNGCESIDQVTIAVEPFVFIASAGANQTICQGYDTMLTASDGDSFLWSTGEMTQSIVVNPTNTQIYTVTVFDGVYEDDAEVEVSVNPNPNVVIENGNNVMILEGEFITLSASGANSYAWDNGATQPNIAVSPSNTTTYEVTGFINSCEDTTAVIVNVLEIVQADAGQDVFICNEEIAILTANGGDQYLWNTGEITQTIEVAPNEDTSYSVLAYNALDSDEATVTVFVEECNSTIEIPSDSETVGFTIYQDPNTDILKVKIDGLQAITAKGYSIYDLAGKVLYTETFSQSEMEDLSQMTRELDVSMYSRGLYMIKLNYDDTSLIKKIPIR